MPKSKRPIENTRSSSRRQASKEALKQMQLLLDDEEDDAFVIPDDEDDKDVVPFIEPPPKKKYKLSHRKSSDGNDRDVIVLKSITNSNYVPKESTLELECVVEELSDVQKERRKKFELEEKELQSKLEELLKGKKAEIVYKGDFSSAIEVNELLSNSTGKKTLFSPKQLPQLGSMEESTPTYQLVMDPRLGMIIGTVQKSNPSPITKNKLQIASAVKAVATLPRSQSPPSTRNTRTRRGVISTPPTPVQTRGANASPIQTRGNNTIPTRSNSILQQRGNSATPTRGSSTVPTRANSVTPTRSGTQLASPSLPVMQTRGMKTTTTIQTRNSKTSSSNTKRPITAIPSEKPKQVVDLTSDDNRSQVDNREIAFNKLQGKTYPSLVVVARPHLRVTDLGADRSKLDSKVKSVLMHPPTKFTEWLIQQGLIRAEQKCPVHGNTQLKLGMYSDVTKFPFSGGYVWISECCPQRFISVFNGSIFEGSPHAPIVMLKLIYHWSCQTNIQNVTQWVKIDNLYVKGVYTWLRGVCTIALQTGMRQLGGPGSKIEVGVISLGTTSHDGHQRQVKVEVLGILESGSKFMRLKAVEPMPEGDRNYRKKFSKILEPILQWIHPASTIVTDLTVDKATLHHMGFMNVIQTTSNEYNNSNRTIMEYLRRIVPRMFQNTLSLLSRQIIQQFLDELVWREWFGTTAQQAFDNIISHLAEHTRTNTQPSLIIKLNKVAANPFRSWTNSSPVNQDTNNTSTPAPSSQVTAANTVPAKTPVTEVKRYGRGRKSNSPQVQTVQERPTKPVSPDVPEQMVPLENYYYGTIESFDPPPSKIVLNLKCPFCKNTFENNLLLQNHLFKHAHNVSNDAYLCRYCLTSVSTANELLFHVNKFHPGETKFDNGFVCLICETHYMNPFVLGKHMSKEHSPHELPYECGSCSFRCSNHKQVIDHFYMRHDGGTTIQCPFCLKSTTVWSGGRNVAQNMHYFIQHLQKHQKKQLAKRCGKCNLWFVQKEVLKEHQQKMHVSLRGRLGLVPNSSPRNGVMVPKSKIDKNPCDAEIINFSSLYYNIPSQSVCKECEQVIASPKHFPSFDSCQNPNCQYSTCCSSAMMTHNAKCKGLNSVIPPEILPFEMFCVCGYKDSDGNSMAKHLAICEKKSAYPSQADAKSATVMHSMLDILGLVRKPEEVAPSKTKENISQESDKTKEDNKETKSDDNTNEVNILSDDEEMEVQEIRAKEVDNKINSDKIDRLGGESKNEPVINMEDEGSKEVTSENEVPNDKSTENESTTSAAEPQNIEKDDNSTSRNLLENNGDNNITTEDIDSENAHNGEDKEDDETKDKCDTEKAAINELTEEIENENTEENEETTNDTEAGVSDSNKEECSKTGGTEELKDSITLENKTSEAETADIESELKGDECIKETEDECIKETEDECIKETEEECIKETEDECIKETEDECEEVNDIESAVDGISEEKNELKTASEDIDINEDSTENDDHVKLNDGDANSENKELNENFMHSVEDSVEPEISDSELNDLIEDATEKEEHSEKIEDTSSQIEENKNDNDIDKIDGNEDDLFHKIDVNNKDFTTSEKFTTNKEKEDQEEEDGDKTCMGDVGHTIAVEPETKTANDIESIGVEEPKQIDNEFDIVASKDLTFSDNMQTNEINSSSLEILNDECKNNVTDNLHEAALNDILSTTNSVSPMDVDLDSELTGIDVGAPMEVE